MEEVKSRRRSVSMKGGELAEDKERAEGLTLVLSTLVKKKEVEMKEEEVMKI